MRLDYSKLFRNGLIRIGLICLLDFAYLPIVIFVIDYTHYTVYNLKLQKKKNKNDSLDISFSSVTTFVHLKKYKVIIMMYVKPIMPHWCVISAYHAYIRMLHRIVVAVSLNRPERWQIGSDSEVDGNEERICLFANYVYCIVFMNRKCTRIWTLLCTCSTDNLVVIFIIRTSIHFHIQNKN